MKKRVLLAGLLAAASFAAGAATGFPYTASLRNADGSMMSGKNVEMTVSLLQGGADGDAVYVERHHAVTDALGAINATIGEGEAVAGEFDSVDWTSAPYFMKVEVTPEAGASIVSVQEMLSVPLAAGADVAEGLTTVASDGAVYQLVVDDYGVVEPIKMPKGYTKLVFHDGFNGSGLPDADKWNCTHAQRINDELEYYTTDRLDNVYVKDGLLHLRCVNNDTIRDATGAVVNYYDDKKTGKIHCITSGRINSKGKGDWTYCYVEARIKVPIAKGTWPAVWMLPSDNHYGYWPNSGEIDIMEHVGYDPLNYNCALHHRNGTKGGKKQLLDSDDWHVIGFDWTEEKMEWLVDGKVYCRITNPRTNWGDWPYDKDFYLVLNLAFGGVWGGQQGVDTDALPLEFLVDYVRVFQK